MSPEPSATERLMEEAELDNLLANGWRLSSSVWMADGNHVLLRKGDQVIGATVTGMKPQGPETPERESVQSPGNLPPGATLDSFLTVAQWATWMGYSLSTAEKYVRRRSFRGAVRMGNGSPVRILPRAYLAGLGKGFKEALS